MIGFRSMHELGQYARSSDLELALILGALLSCEKVRVHQ